MNADTSLPKCRYCDLPVAPNDSAPTHAYWHATPFVCHKSCKQEGERQEAYDCQCIDADCNDCGHFKRGKLIDKNTWSGHCLLKNEPTFAYPKTSTSRPCFVHRRDLPKPTPHEPQATP